MNRDRPEITAHQGRFLQVSIGRSNRNRAAVGDAMLAVSMIQAAPSIQPAAVEMEVEGEIANVKVRGFIDLLDTSGRIIDCKTDSQEHAAVASYSFAIGLASSSPFFV